MAKKTLSGEEMRQQNVAEAVSKTELFFQNNSRLIYTCVGIILGLALVIFLYTRFYLIPKRAEAKAEMVRAEQWFQGGEYELALAGDDNFMGFEEILSKYGAKAGKSVYMYAGLSYLHTGEYEQAVKTLKKYNGKDNILLARAESAVGDAYVNLGETANAVKWYLKAAKTSDNELSAGYLVKAGTAAEAAGDKDSALKYYTRAKEEHPEAFQYQGVLQGTDIDKYISRIGE